MCTKIIAGTRNKTSKGFLMGFIGPGIIAFSSLCCRSPVQHRDKQIHSKYMLNKWLKSDQFSTICSKYAEPQKRPFPLLCNKEGRLGPGTSSLPAKAQISGSVLPPPLTSATFENLVADKFSVSLSKDIWIVNILFIIQVEDVNGRL